MKVFQSGHVFDIEVTSYSKGRSATMYEPAEYEEIDYIIHSILPEYKEYGIDFECLPAGVIELDELVIQAYKEEQEESRIDY